MPCGTGPEIFENRRMVITQKGLRGVFSVVVAMLASLGWIRQGAAQSWLPQGAIPGQQPAPMYQPGPHRPIDISTPELKALNDQARELAQRGHGSCRNLGKDKYKVYSKEVQALIKDANSRGYRVVAYTDDGLHEDIFELRLRSDKEDEDKVAPVQFASQYGIHPTKPYIWPKNKNQSRSEYTKEQNYSLNRRHDGAWIDDIVVVTPTKLRQLEQLNNFWDVDSPVHSDKPFVIQTCWTYAESAWNEWLDTPIQYANGGMCESVNRIGGDPGALRFLCAKKYCNPSSKEYKFCMVENKIEIDACFSKFQHCLFQGTTARKPAWRQLP